LIDSCHSLSNGAEDVVFLCGLLGKAGFSLKVKPSATHTSNSKQRNDALTDAYPLEFLTADTNLHSCPSCTAASFVYKLGAKSRMGIQAQSSARRTVLESVRKAGRERDFLDSRGLAGCLVKGMKFSLAVGIDGSWAMS
jgi:hypothetical protein